MKVTISIPLPEEIKSLARERLATATPEEREEMRRSFEAEVGQWTDDETKKALGVSEETGLPFTTDGEVSYQDDGVAGQDLTLEFAEACDRLDPPAKISIAKMTAVLLVNPDAGETLLEAVSAAARSMQDTKH